MTEQLDDTSMFHQQELEHRQWDEEVRSMLAKADEMFKQVMEIREDDDENQ